MELLAQVRKISGGFATAADPEWDQEDREGSGGIRAPRGEGVGRDSEGSGRDREAPVWELLGIPR
jgi:hypothetical protein